MIASRRLAPLAIAVLACAPLAVACSSDTKDNAKDTAESIEQDASDNLDEAGKKVDEGRARVAAEDLRARLKENETAGADGVRSMAAIQESLKDVADDPTATGLEDTDGDGLDDDGKVQLDVEDASACLTLPESGTDTSVEGGAC